MAEPVKAADETTALLSSKLKSTDDTHSRQHVEHTLPSLVDESVTESDGTLPTGKLLLIVGSGWLGVILAALDGTMVATLTASISDSFNSLSLLAWIAASYFIANSVLQPIAGKLTDIYGRRAGLVVCNIMFCAGNLICGLSNTESLLIFGRVVAGLGGGGLNAIPLFVTNDLIPLRRRGVWQGFNNICFGVGSGLGGIVGGYINDSLGWRWAFLILVPLTIVSGLMVTFFLRMPKVEVKESAIQEKWNRIDFAGSFTLATAIVMLCFALNTGGNIVPWDHPIVLVCLPVSALVFAAFVYIEANVAIEPVIPVRLFLNRTVLAACLTSWFFSMSQIALTFYSPIYFQVKGASATRAGMFLIPTSVGAAIGGISCGYIMRASGKYWTLNLVIQAMFLIPLGLTTQLTLDSSDILPIFYFFSTGFAYAGKLTVTITALIAAVDQSHAAVVTSASYAFRGTGSTIGISICSLVFQNILHTRLWESFGRTKNAAELIDRLRNSLAMIKYLPQGDMQRDARLVYMDALRGVFTTIFALAVVGTVASLFMKEYTLHKDMARRRS